jgi:hypothetical protein
VREERHVIPTLLILAADDVPTWACAVVGFGFIGLLCLPVVGIAVMILSEKWAERGKRRRPGFCPRCRYDLTGNVSGECPECGTPVVAPPR